MSSRPQSPSPPSFRLARPGAVDAGEPEQGRLEETPPSAELYGSCASRRASPCAAMPADWEGALVAAPKQQVELARPPEVCRQQRFHSHVEPRLLEDFARKAGLWTLGVFEPAAGQAPRHLPPIRVLQHQDAALIILNERHRADHEGRIQDAQEQLAHPAWEGHVAPDAQQEATVRGHQRSAVSDQLSAGSDSLAPHHYEPATRDAASHSCRLSLTADG